MTEFPGDRSPSGSGTRIRSLCHNGSCWLSSSSMGVDGETPPGTSFLSDSKLNASRQTHLRVSSPLSLLPVFPLPGASH